MSLRASVSATDLPSDMLRCIRLRHIQRATCKILQASACRPCWVPHHEHYNQESGSSRVEHATDRILPMRHSFNQMTSTMPQRSALNVAVCVCVLRTKLRKATCSAAPRHVRSGGSMLISFRIGICKPSTPSRPCMHPPHKHGRLMTFCALMCSSGDASTYAHHACVSTALLLCMNPSF